MVGEINLGSASDLYFAIVSGDDGQYTSIPKFGRNAAVGTTPVAICIGGTYQTPTAAATVKVVSTSSSDTAGGVGARVITVKGLDASFTRVEEDIAMSGTTATSYTTNSFIRVYKIFVKESGAYANSTSGSHVGTITASDSSGNVYGKIDSTNFARSRSQIGAYTVGVDEGPIYIKNVMISTSAAANVLLFDRQNADTVSAPYSVMGLIREFPGVVGQLPLLGPFGPFTDKTDLGFMAFTASGTAEVSVDFEIIQSI